MGIFLAIIMAVIGVVMIRSLSKNNLAGKQKKNRIIVSAICFVFAFMFLCTGISAASSPKATSAPATQENNTSASQEESPAPTVTPSTMKVHYIDVGQGDSEFIELPDGKTMLIDAGVADAGNTVVNYIKSLGCTKIDYLVASHPHEDHIGGMVAVLNAFPVGEVWAPNVTDTTKTYESFLDTIAAKGLTITRAVAGKTIYANQDAKCEADLLAPDASASYSDLNDWSAIIKIKYNQETFLFPGDASANIIASACKDKVNVLKVAHHGSDTGTSAALIKQLSPSYAVISCGAGNSYGHPHASTISALKSISLFRTDVQHTITATSDGTYISFDKSPTTDFSAGTKPSTSVATPSTQTPAPAPSTANPPSSSVDKSAITVYVTKSGKKYHNEGCSYLNKSCIPMSLSDAEAQGYTPCSRCKPPA